MGNGEFLHPMRNVWGRTDLLFGIELETLADNKLCLSSYVWQTFNFFVNNVLETIFVKQEREQI